MSVKRRRRQKDYGKLFNGNVYNEGEFIFIWFLILAFGLGAWLYMLNISAPVDESRCTAVPLTVKNVTVKENSNTDLLCFTVYENDEEYSIGGWAIDKENFLEDIHGGSRINAVFEGKEIVSLYTEDKIYLEVSALNDQRKEMRGASWIILALVGMWALYIAVSWYVMYNAEKFPRLVKLFVKPSYLNKHKKG